MIHQLKRIFPTLIIYNKQEEPSKTVILNEKYVWFTTNENEIIRINKSDVSKKDMQLLKTFLQTYPTKLPSNTISEQKWLKRINHHSNEKAKHSNYGFS